MLAALNWSFPSCLAITVQVPMLDAQGKVRMGKDDKPMTTSQTITVTNKATNRVNKGEKYKISASTESDD